MKSFNWLTLSALICFCASIISSQTWACTGIQLKTKDGSFVNGRTVEFGVNIDIGGIVVPRNYEFKGTLPDGKPGGLTYRSKYAVVGAGTYGSNAIIDGVNEKGLSAATFYFPGYAGYANVTQQNQNQALSSTEFPNWILTQFATTDEVKEGLKSVTIVPTIPKGWGQVPPPFHYVIYDKSGKSIVIEPINGELKVYDNPIGVMTNSPSFDWHLTNLSNYINLSPINALPVNVDGLKLQQFGQGSGLHGLPGDFTPPSRFVRAALFSSTAKPADNAQQAVFQAFHILNQFDIPVGAIQEEKNNQPVVSDFTQATSVKDPQNLKYYLRTYDDQTIRMINLNAFDLNAKNIKVIDVNGTQQIVDISNKARVK